MAIILLVVVISTSYGYVISRRDSLVAYPLLESVVSLHALHLIPASRLVRESRLSATRISASTNNNSRIYTNDEDARISSTPLLQISSFFFSGTLLHSLTNSVVFTAVMTVARQASQNTNLQLCQSITAAYDNSNTMTKPETAH